VGRELFWFLVTVAVAAGVTVAIALGFVTLSVLIFAVIGSFLVLRLATAISTDADRQWLPTLLLAGFLAKLVGAVFRFLMVTVLYGQGDAYLYHQAGADLVHEWRKFMIPVAVGRDVGTRFTEIVTAFVYIPGVPSMLAGFLIFSALAFLGVVAAYAAFRRLMPSDLLKPYAIAIFFMPSLLFWPSSIGKDALMILSIGVICLGAAWVFDRRHLRGVLLMLPGLGLAVGIRPHVAAMLVGAVVLAVALSRTGISFGTFSRFLAVGIAIGAMLLLASTAATRLGLKSNSEGLDEFLAETERQTLQGGSAVEGDTVLANPLSLPEATLRVIFRPLPGESASPAMLVSSLEGGLFLAFTIYRLPTLLFNLRRIRSYPYMIFALAYSFEFVVAFSAIFNLGILARQRTQLHILLLAVLIGLGWRKLAPEREVAPGEAPVGVGA
jgi:hypothetical protein